MAVPIQWQNCVGWVEVSSKVAPLLLSLPLLLLWHKSNNKAEMRDTRRGDKRSTGLQGQMSGTWGDCSRHKRQTQGRLSLYLSEKKKRYGRGGRYCATRPSIYGDLYKPQSKQPIVCYCTLKKYHFSFHSLHGRTSICTFCSLHWKKATCHFGI